MVRVRLEPRFMVLRWSMLAVIAAAFLLAPFFLYEQALEQAVERFLDSRPSRAAAAIALAALLASDVALPIPSSLTATAAGLLLGWPLGALVNWAGLNAGAALGYCIGMTAGRAAARRVVGVRGLERAAEAHRRWGDWSLIVSRAAPVLAEASVVFAGAARMRPARFALLVGLSNAAIAAVYAAVGALAMETEAFLLAFAGSIALPGLAMLLTRGKSVGKGA